MTRSGDTTIAATVDYAVTGGAADGADFAGGALPSGQVSFATGETSKTIVIEVAGDSAIEPDEDFTVTLSNPSAGGTISQATATGTIQNDDAAILSIAAANADQSEGDSGVTPFTFTVTRSGDTTIAATVDYAVTGGMADGADFSGILPSGQISFAAGETSKTITIDVTGDTAFEPDETFTVTLANPSAGATIQQAAATGTIRNDDAAYFAIVALDAAKEEGNSGTTPYSFTVTRSGDTMIAATVDYTVGGAADAADFGGVLPAGQISFAAGETSKTLTLDVTGDTTPEFDEDFTVTLSNPSVGAVISQASASGTIWDDGDAAYLELAGVNVDRPEGDSSATAFTFTAIRFGNLGLTSVVDYSITGGTADAADFGGVLPSGQLTFAPGESAKTITVIATGDTAFEPDETFTVALAGASAGTFASRHAQVTATIRNDDILTADLAIAAASADKTEGDAGATPFTFTVTRSGDTASVVTVDYLYARGTADAADFAAGVLPAGQISFAAGETVKTITIDVAGDTAFEADEDFTLTLANPSVGAAITQATATGNIRNDDFVSTITGTSGDDNLNGTADGDLIMGLAGNDTLSGLDGDDTLIGGAGADVLIGGAGTDTASYATATSCVDVRLLNSGGFAGDAAGDSLSGIENLTGSDFDDVLVGDIVANSLIGGGGNDSLNGYFGNDMLNGGAGDDALIGSDGDDTLFGGAGNDQMSGGLGNDWFVFRPGDGADRITDFSAGAGPGDRIFFDNGAAAPTASPTFRRPQPRLGPTR